VIKRGEDRHAQLQAKRDATERRAAHFGEMVRVRMLRLT
jgi:hypothetical protein